MATTKKPNPVLAEAPEPISLRIDGGYIVARHGDRVEIFELIWEKRHGDTQQKLTLRRCQSVPRQFEREVFGEVHVQ